MPATHAHDSPRLLALLAALAALGPLSVDMYLPAMPGMMRAFETDIAHMHLTASTYLWGFALFHLACGPLADRFGRRPVLIGGTLLFIAASLGCAQATSVLELAYYRFVQGIGACVGPTLARTIARDVYGPTRAARALSLIAMLMALAPAVAPGLGGIMLRFVPWPSVFLFLASYAVVIALLVFRYLPETLPQRQSLHPLAIARNYGELILHPFFLAVSIAGALVYAGLLAYLTSSGFVFIDMLGVPLPWFGLIFLTSVVGYMSGSALSARLASHHRSETVMLAGSVTALASTAFMFAGHRVLPHSVLALVLPMTFYALALGLVMPHAMAIALRPFAHIAGTASALLGFVQMGLAALVTAVVGQLLVDSPLPLILCMLGAAALGLVLAGWVQWRGEPADALPAAD
ncbi:MAG TPA: multidrug effflux MFS transporter [Pseudohaliea sp.]|nr:multidrug effflux MFS transporter [Pseudohaliea sp.]